MRSLFSDNGQVYRRPDARIYDPAKAILIGIELCCSHDRINAQLSILPNAYRELGAIMIRSAYVRNIVCARWQG